MDQSVYIKWQGLGTYEDLTIACPVLKEDDAKVLTANEWQSQSVNGLVLLAQYVLCVVGM
jgi:hypothetical protein